MAHNEDHYLDENELKILSIATRVAAFISFLASVYLAKAAWSQRYRLYHRFMFCLACHTVMYALWNLYGSAAIPRGTENSWGAVGTVRTCTAQGVGIQISYAVPLYYVFLSLYSYVAVCHNFDASKYLWTEKWIHLVANGFPIVSALFLWHLEALNYGGNGLVCWINSLPLDCGSDSGIECTRGPQNIDQVTWIFAGLPIMFVLVLPTCVMVLLYCKVRRRQDTIRLQANSVASQAGLYLFALYWSYIFSAVNREVTQAANLGIATLSAVNLNLFGFWLLLIYLRFRVQTPQPKVTTKTLSVSDSPVNNPMPLDDQDHVKQSARQQTTKSRPVAAFEFNIFDGTNPTTDFSEYVFEGDEDDAAYDRAQSQMWNDIQDHV